MTTKPPPKVKELAPDEALKKIYNMVEEFKDIIPVTNDRYRLGFCLNRYYTGEAATIGEALRSARPHSTVNLDELEKLITEKYKRLNLKP